MRQYQCRCGYMKSFGSDAPAPCTACDLCGENAYGNKPMSHESAQNSCSSVVDLFCIRCGLDMN